MVEIPNLKVILFSIWCGLLNILYFLNTYFNAKLNISDNLPKFRDRFPKGLLYVQCIVNTFNFTDLNLKGNEF